MSQWRTQSISSFCEKIYSGGTPNTKKAEYWGGNLKWLSSGETRNKYIFDTEKRITELGAKESSTRLAYSGDVVMASAGQGYTRGQVSMLKTDTFVNQSVIVFRTDSNELLSDYLYYNLSNRYDELRALSDSNSIRGSITTKLFNSMEISIPTLDIQKKIVDTLGSIDEKIENNKKINHHLADVIDAQFGQLLENNELFESTFSELGEIVGGGTPSKKVEEYWNGDIPWLSPKDLSLNTALFTSKGQNSITELGYKKSSAKMMPQNSILFSSRAPIGYITIAENDISTNQGFKSIVPNPEYPYTFLYELLKQETPSLESSASGSTFKEVSGTHLKQHIVEIPSITAIKDFHEFVEPLFQAIRLNEKEIQKLIETRDILLPKLMTGEISVVS